LIETLHVLFTTNDPLLVKKDHTVSILRTCASIWNVNTIVTMRAIAPAIFIDFD